MCDVPHLRIRTMTGSPWLPVAVCLCLVVLLFPCTSNARSADEKPSEKVRLQLKWRHHFQFAGYYAAIEKGYYREAGLEVALIEGQPGVDFVAEVTSGRARDRVDRPRPRWLADELELLLELLRRPGAA